jgi:hypothetical protein
MGPAQAAEVTRMLRVVSQSGVADANFGQQEMGIVHSSAFLWVGWGWERSEVDMIRRQGSVDGGLAT